ncbi:MAG: tRNA (adenosine(37)-N6)-threonylcarbamoyltransferase complex transferase subunit TsaD [Candidatus Magasanikbacteria bacterium]|nr:tRNA (adenosine(37)-N6)-threonylcarbamoyltransferase complex transferase subunit TsaD [Candidatus Magasanikbacteria bacterium]
MLILGIETSCDETSLALVEAKDGGLWTRQNLVSSQINLHQKYGGVVPEVAARRHVEKIGPLITKLLKERHSSTSLRGVYPDKYRGRNDKFNKPDVIAVTVGPGLATALLVGVETARALSYLLKIPLIAVNHLEGHIYANFLDKIAPLPQKIFPVMALIISGGHTELILMKNHLNYRLLGQTRDDAAGECFDKVGKILGLPYPGGPEVAKLAKTGDATAVNFPRPLFDSPDFDFSFSGLKTAVLYHTQKNKTPSPDICASFQAAAIETIIAKTLRAARRFRAKTLLLGGGVAANAALRRQLKTALRRQSPETQCQIPAPRYCADNAAMIAAAGYFHALRKDFVPWQKIKINPNWELTQKFI